MTTLTEQLLIWFAGDEPPPHIERMIHAHRIAGVTLYRHLNSAPPERIAALTTRLQAMATAAGYGPLLIGADQEGGQLQALPGLTAFPGAMALGATRSPALAFRVGAAIGAELAALGVNLVYAPVCDVNTNPHNPVIGVRAFGDDPALVGTLAAAMVAGFQQSGVAATVKHFPGHGDTSADSHYGLASVTHPITRLQEIEWPPFAAAIAAGTQAVMIGHLAVPALGATDLPATRAPEVIAVLRRQLSFGGVAISDALDMAAFAPDGNVATALREAAQAGIDLLLLGEGNDLAQTIAILNQIDGGETAAAARQRIAALRRWLREQARPDLSVVGCAAHGALADEVAQRAITLVRDRAGILPVRIPAMAHIAVVMPQPVNLTPADTSATERPALADAVRRYHTNVSEHIITIDPTSGEIADLLAAIAGADLIILGTINAQVHRGQAQLAQALIQRKTPLITVALRLPSDLLAYPQAPTHLCSYSIQPVALRALAAGLWGDITLRGQLPVRGIEQEAIA
ncbi:glycoside hydrolase family 3 protein [Chloroflexus sp.]|uniref:glycoside hydrolase family 3 protein n=1 Tax=Chloroflexus sp. TaxID=1904827 RepID=UPI002ACD8359|nr:glycoside hydrolase family 3 N-terminal domain-containing protein [Chloroflexus sp.]